MNHLSLAAALLCLSATWAHAQTAAPANPATKPAAKPTTKHTAAAPSKTPAKPVAPGLPAASAEQLDAAKLTYLGPYDCDHGQTLAVQSTPKHEGYVDVHHHKTVWTMKPVLSSTGALRLEDVKGRMLMLQVANKSMVLDTKVGQRVIDGCLHATQKAFVKPADQVGLGIAPPTASPAGAASTPR